MQLLLIVAVFMTMCSIRAELNYSEWINRNNLTVEFDTPRLSPICHVLAVIPWTKFLI